MIFVMLLLLQSVIISNIYWKDLTLLINSDAEQAFQKFLLNKTDSKYKRKSETVMQVYNCCGWNSFEEMVENDINRTPLEILPCYCCYRGNDPENKKCNKLVLSRDFAQEDICSLDSVYLKEGPCKTRVQKVLVKDLEWIGGFIILTIFVCIITTILTFVISNDLLKIHHE